MKRMNMPRMATTSMKKSVAARGAKPGKQTLSKPPKMPSYKVKWR